MNQQVRVPAGDTGGTMADSTEPGPAHDLFEYLANEEAGHKRELEKTCYELVHRGGV